MFLGSRDVTLSEKSQPIDKTFRVRRCSNTIVDSAYILILRSAQNFFFSTNAFAIPIRNTITDNQRFAVEEVQENRFQCPTQCEHQDMPQRSYCHSPCKSHWRANSCCTVPMSMSIRGQSLTWFERQMCCERNETNTIEISCYKEPG